MGLGSTAKKVQRVSQLAEKLYDAVNEVLDRLAELHDRVEGATEEIEDVRREQREQRAILEALAEEQGVDVEAVVAAIDEREGTSAGADPADRRGESTGAGESPGDDGDADDPADADESETPADAN